LFTLFRIIVTRQTPLGGHMASFESEDLRIPVYASRLEWGDAVEAHLDQLLVTCATCSAKPVDPLRCVGCQCVAYCGVACQRTHWSARHKRECKILAAKNFHYIHGLAGTNPSAAFDAGVMLERGLGTAPDAAKALVLYQEVVAKTDGICISAHVQIGHILNVGAAGVARDFPGSARAFLSAAELGDHVGAINYGLYCVYGKGVRVNGADALRWLQFAVDVIGKPNDPLTLKAHYEMGRVHLFGIGGAIIDEQKAERCFVLAADAGDADSAYSLVGLLGMGGPTESGRVDLRAARKWAKQAIKLGKDARKVNELLEAMNC
jgi:TPR repeat protein